MDSGTAGRDTGAAAPETVLLAPTHARSWDDAAAPGVSGSEVALRGQPAEGEEPEDRGEIRGDHPVDDRHGDRLLGRYNWLYKYKA